MEWFNPGAFIGGMIAVAIGFIIGWWARGNLSSKRDRESRKMQD